MLRSPATVKYDVSTFRYIFLVVRCRLLFFLSRKIPDSVKHLALSACRLKYRGRTNVRAPPYQTYIRICGDETMNEILTAVLDYYILEIVIYSFKWLFCI